MFTSEEKETIKMLYAPKMDAESLELSPELRKKIFEEIDLKRFSYKSS